MPNASAVVRSVVLFLVAGVCEIGGGWLVWKWLRDHRPGWWGLLGVGPDPLRRHPDAPGEPLRADLRRVRRLLHRAVVFANEPGLMKNVKTWKRFVVG